MLTRSFSPTVSAKLHAGKDLRGRARAPPDNLQGTPEGHEQLAISVTGQQGPNLDDTLRFASKEGPGENAVVDYRYNLLMIVTLCI